MCESVALGRAQIEVVQHTLKAILGGGLKRDQSAAVGEERFSLAIPNGPYSFSGKLVSLLWGLRLMILPSQEQTQVNLTVSPTGEEINLVG